MKNSVKPVVVLIIFFIGAIVIESFAVPNLFAQLPHPWADGCYCHNGGVGLYVNKTDFMSGLGFAAGGDATSAPIVVKSGSRFALLLRAEQVQIVQPELIQPTIRWIANATDNANFKFDPQEVKDNSPQDQDPTEGRVLALFQIVAPNKTGSYQISLSTFGLVQSLPVTVRSTSFGSAMIAKIQAPREVETGQSVKVNTTLRNTGLAPTTLYVYATNNFTGQLIFAKMYSQKPVHENETITLNGTFSMPFFAIVLKMHSGHVVNGADVDDAVSVVSIKAPSPSSPPFLQVLAEELGPVVIVVAAAVVTFQLVKFHDRKRAGDVRRHSGVSVDTCNRVSFTLNSHRNALYPAP